MHRSILAVALAVLVPAAGASGLLPVGPIMDGGFELDARADAGPAGDALGVCIGVGHQALDPVYALDTASPTLADDALAYGVATADAYAADPSDAYGCRARDAAWVDPAAKLADPSPLWSSDAGTEFGDFNGDGDREVRVPSVPVEHTHALWQSIATSTQAWSADFDAFAFRVESGSIPAGANVQVGLSLTPGYMQSPWIGAFWEGAVLFRANDMVRAPDGSVVMDPVSRGEIICPAGYTPCLAFKADYAAADVAGKRTLLGQARIVQTSFWNFHSPSPVVLDDVSYLGAKTAAETIPNPNPGA